MLTKPQVAAIIAANFADNRIFATPLFVSKLLERSVHGGGIDRYRMTNTLTGQPITTEAEFLAAVNACDFTLNYPFDSEPMSTDRVTGFYVTVKNISIKFHQYSEEDAFFGRFLDFGRHPDHRYGVQFYLGYMNDGDEVLPIKVIWQRMYHLKD
ncbi:MAG: hypothetical protein PHN51_11685 [Candidatus Nanopelagicales bacterium]|nr:hypothetical protein [Candidatus Nanopelagicales bacterium]